MSFRRLVVGNWKMHGTRTMLAEARAMDRAAARVPQVDAGIAPPFTLIHTIAEAVEHMAVGGQDCHAQASGAYTGDVSATMLEDAGAAFVIVGHSERRSAENFAQGSFGHDESDALVSAKASAALNANLSVILCVGESEKIRDAGKAESVVTTQLEASLPTAQLSEDTTSTRLSVAYEPIWAIGTGRVPTFEQISEMHKAIRAQLIKTYGPKGSTIRILYGGSVNADNAATILAIDEVGGALVGGASLVAESFAAIMHAAAQA